MSYFRGEIFTKHPLRLINKFHEVVKKGYECFTGLNARNRAEVGRKRPSHEVVPSHEIVRAQNFPEISYRKMAPESWAERLKTAKKPRKPE